MLSGMYTSSGWYVASLLFLYFSPCKRKLLSRWLRFLTRIHFNFKIVLSELNSLPKRLYADHLASIMLLPYTDSSVQLNQRLFDWEMPLSLSFVLPNKEFQHEIYIPLWYWVNSSLLQFLSCSLWSWLFLQFRHEGSAKIEPLEMVPCPLRN